MKGTKYRLALYMLFFAAGIAVTVYILLRQEYVWLMLTVPVALFTGYRMFRLFSENIRKLTFMLSAIANGDYTFRFTEYDGTMADNMLNMTLNRMKEILVREKDDVVRREQYYSVILNCVSTGILVFHENGSVYQANDEAVRMFGLPVLTHVKQLARVDESLPAVFWNMIPDEKKTVQFTNERGVVTLSVRCSAVNMSDRQMKIVALNEIGSELAEHEVDSWIRLIRVLTHEIMNSVTPITSLSQTLMEMTGPDMPELQHGLQTINTAGRGLTNFVESYRQLTRMPAPRLTLFDLKPFLRRAASAVSQQYPCIPISITVEPDDLILHADENLIFQVVSNLLKNAAEAVSSEPDGHIHITAQCAEGERVTITIANTGRAIAPEILPHIFIPFFTTKEHGSGIGLSLSRQIMRMHGGSLSVKSADGATCFTIGFA